MIGVPCNKLEYILGIDCVHYIIILTLLEDATLLLILAVDLAGGWVMVK